MESARRRGGPVRHVVMSDSFYDTATRRVAHDEKNEGRRGGGGTISVVDTDDFFSTGEEETDDFSSTEEEETDARSAATATLSTNTGRESTSNKTLSAALLLPPPLPPPNSLVVESERTDEPRTSSKTGVARILFCTAVQMLLTLALVQFVCHLGNEMANASILAESVRGANSELADYCNTCQRSCSASQDICDEARRVLSMSPWRLQIELWWKHVSSHDRVSYVAGRFLANLLGLDESGPSFATMVGWVCAILPIAAGVIYTILQYFSMVQGSCLVASGVCAFVRSWCGSSSVAATSKKRADIENEWSE